MKKIVKIVSERREDFIETFEVEADDDDKALIKAHDQWLVSDMSKAIPVGEPEIKIIDFKILEVDNGS